MCPPLDTPHYYTQLCDLVLGLLTISLIAVVFWLQLEITNALSDAIGGVDDINKDLTELLSILSTFADTLVANP